MHVGGQLHYLDFHLPELSDKAYLLRAARILSAFTINRVPRMAYKIMHRNEGWGPLMNDRKHSLSNIPKL